MIFTENGTGIPLVLVHGFPVDGRMWLEVSGALSHAFRVIVPDLPGFGRSTPAVPFTIDSVADALVAQLAAIEALPCVLAGFSMGGYIALSLAAQRAEAIRGLVLVDTRADADTPEGREGRGQMIQVARTAGSVAVAELMLPKMLSAGTLAERPDVVTALRRIMESSSPSAIEHALAAMRDRADRTNDLASINVPTLILVGDADSITPPATAEAMSRRIPGSVVRIIPGAGHMSPLEQPCEVSRVMLEWLAHSVARASRLC